MRIVFDIALLGRGGMERQVMDVAGGLRSRGHAVLIVANKSVEAYRQEAAEAGLEILELGADRLTVLRTAVGVVRACKSAGADVIVGVNFNATVFSRLAALWLGIASVTAEHSTSRGRPMKVLWANRLLASGTDAILACARAQVDSLVDEGNPRRRIKVVHNGVDTERFRVDCDARVSMREQLHLPGDVPLVGIVAAHRREKRHDRFLDLMSALRTAIPNVQGVGIGGGPLLEANRRLLKERKLEGVVEFIGPVDNPLAAYNACDVIVLLSDSVETLPLSMMEAEACGVPVVAMRTGGVEEALADGQTGFLVAQGDIRGTATRVAELLVDQSLRRTMGARGREWIAANRSLEQMIDGYERVLTQAVASHRGASRP